MTTIEFCEKRENEQDLNSAYDRGVFANISEVLGHGPVEWLLPIGTVQGNGLVFPPGDDTSSEPRQRGAGRHEVGIGHGADDPEASTEEAQVSDPEAAHPRAPGDVQEGAVQAA